MLRFIVAQFFKSLSCKPTYFIRIISFYNLPKSFNQFLS